jgi:DNA primase
MKSVNHNTFVSWLEKHFDVIKERGPQLQVNSFFHEDKNFKLYCNTDKNCYHCWLSSESGSLFKLVSIVEKCSYKEAMQILGVESEIHNLHEKVKELYKNKKETPIDQVVKQIGLPDGASKISDLSNDNPFKIKAIKYLSTRKIDCGDLYIGCFGPATDRIIIPYYNKNGALLYWNARTIVGHPQKYMFPLNDGTGKGDFLYFPVHKNESKIYITEGEFNAITLSQMGFFSASTGGKQATEKQIRLLKNYDVVVCYDNDKPGRIGTCKVAKELISDRFGRQVNYVLPPKDVNDWNDMLKDGNLELVKNYILSNEKRFSEGYFKVDYYMDFC